jgi:hypothetical protein
MFTPANHINKYLPAAILYFFLNAFLLPVGLLYTTLLTPLLLIWVARYRNVRPTLLYFLMLIPFIIAHSLLEVDWAYYGYSLALCFSVFVFGLAFYQYVLSCTSLREIFQSILLINAFMTVIALIALPVPGLREFFWYNKTLSRGIEGIERLKMLTYEGDQERAAPARDLPGAGTHTAIPFPVVWCDPRHSTELADSAHHPGGRTASALWRFAPDIRMGLAAPGRRRRCLPVLS